MSVRSTQPILFAILAIVAPGLALASGGDESGGTMIWQLVNFLLLLGVLFFVARKPLVNFFADRREEIQGDIQTATDLLAQAESRHGELQRKLVDLEDEMDSIRETARARAREEREHILADARQAAERIRHEAGVAVERELRRAKQDLAREASELSIELAAQLLREQVTEGDRDRLMDEFTSSIERQPSDQPSDIRGK